MPSPPHPLGTPGLRIQAELARTASRIFPTDPLRALAILTEEVGEVAEAVLDYTRINGNLTESNLTQVEDELIHVGAVVHNWLITIHRLRFGKGGSNA